jgi:hypothetical protein
MVVVRLYKLSELIFCLYGALKKKGLQITTYFYFFCLYGVLILHRFREAIICTKAL